MDQNIGVRWGLLSNQNTPDNVLNKLLDGYKSRSEYDWIQTYNAWLIKHPNISSKTLHRIAKVSDNFYIKLDIIQSSKVYLKTLKYLSKDSNRKISQEALKYLEIRIKPYGVK